MRPDSAAPLGPRPHAVAVTRSPSRAVGAIWVTALILLALWFCVRPAPADTEAGAAAPVAASSTLLQEAQKFIDAAEFEKAEAALLKAVEVGPDRITAFLKLGRLYETMSRTEEALEVYAHLLSKVDKNNLEARAGLHRVFYRDRFPRQFGAAYLSLSPVGLTADKCALAPGEALGPDEGRGFAFTTTLLFPESMTHGKAAPWIRLPAGSGVFGNFMYNRVAYGIIADPGNELLRTRWMVGYPSASILASGNDYAELATKVLHLALRGHIYIQEYLGIDRPVAQGGLLQAFLSEEGPTGAEQLDDTIFFYDVDSERAPVELLRQVFHEVGHMLLPRIGPVSGDDRWVSGDLGERLLFQWLLEEAGTVTGAPWPSDAAADALEGLCGLKMDAGGQYLLESCRLPVNAWVATSPESFEGDDAAERFAGFCLWVQAAHGRAFLAALLQQAEGSAPSDYVAAYRKVVGSVMDKDGSLRVGAAGINPVASKLMQAPVEGAIKREIIALGKGGVASFRAFLPAGVSALSVEHGGGANAALSVALDGGAPHAFNAAEDVSIEGVTEGWHQITVSCASEGPVEITALTLKKATED